MLKIFPKKKSFLNLFFFFFFLLWLLFLEIKKKNHGYTYHFLYYIFGGIYIEIIGHF